MSELVPHSAPPEMWAQRIGAAWQKSIDAIFETGRLIAEAKAALPHGQFTKMIETQLPFGDRAARMLMSVAADEKLTDRKHASVLPPSWATLYELTKLDKETFERRIAEGTIRPDMQRRDVATGGARSIMASREQPGQSLDYFPTPPFATRALMEVVLPHLGVVTAGAWPGGMGVVREPACGEGHMSGVLLEYLPEVLASDIADYSRNGVFPPGWIGQADFVEEESEADWYITNPPFGDMTLAFVLAALRRARKGVAMFVRQQWLEGIERYNELFRDRPPTLYAQFAERVPLCEKKWDPFGSTATAYCWLVWVRDMPPQPPFWIPPGQRKTFFYADDQKRFTAHPVLPPARSVPLPFSSSPEVDAIIAAGYAADPFDMDVILARLLGELGIAATPLQVRRRANQKGLGDRARQKEAVSASNIRRGQGR